MYKLAVFVPATHLQQVKTAMFNAGGGRIGEYDCCAWQTLGTGQFRPLAGSNPYLGEHGQVETVQEFKVEMVCDDALLKAVLRAMREAHPYEEPAFDVWRLESVSLD